MARRYGCRWKFQKLAGLVLGICFGVLLSSWCRHTLLPCGSQKDRCCIHINYHVNIAVEHLHVTDQLPQKTLPVSETKEFRLNRYIKPDERGFLLIGVITAKKFLDTRAVAAFDTWTSTCQGVCKVLFFSSEGSSSHKIPVISIDGVDDSYPPQRKSLLMLKYMHDNYINNFEWFMRADDDVFIKGDRIEKLLRSINSSIPQYIGQAGIGKKEELGKLYLKKNENFCMGGPGVVFSHMTLRMFAPHVGECLQNLLTTHEDVEVGRCVRDHTGVSCTWAFEMQRLFFQNYKEEKGSFRTTLKDKAVKKAVTLHSVKEPKQQYKIYNYLKSLHIQDLQQKGLLLQREISNIDRMLGAQTAMGKQGLPPSLSKTIPKSTKDILPWDFISKAIVSHKNLNPRHGLTFPLKVALDDVISQVIQIVNRNARQKGRTIDYKDLWYGYRRVNPLHGADFVLDILLTYKKHTGNKVTVAVRRHAYLQQAFGEINFIEDPFTSNYYPPPDEIESPFLFKQFGAGNQSSLSLISNKVEEVIHFILPLMGRLNIFKRFMTNYEEVCLKTGAKTELHVVLFNDSYTDTLINLIGRYQKKYGGENIEVIFAEGSFARAKALDLGAIQCDQNDLLFFIDVDILFTSNILHRIRMNTKRGSQVYYPIVFSQYDPSFLCSFYKIKPCHIDNFNLSADTGYWRNFGFGIASMYKSDLELVGGFDTSIQGWGKEDVDLYTKFSDSEIQIFRGVDPDMVHLYHSVHCDSGLNDAQMTMCIGSKSASYASMHVLTEVIRRTPEILNRDPGS
ncbi:chondroitin sulfate synthase 1-like [Saccostrea echinata]|uniref:chondroitin sulfate synthase 1-like n=1 Tax=Saccostrea echinata TaxID=191078 RepID=UPI002A8268C7|nr:chondroitin sulfate synthase 1-like [Saccostrea echinata]